jgi:hypothetical protein
VSLRVTSAANRMRDSKFSTNIASSIQLAKVFSAPARTDRGT